MEIFRKEYNSWDWTEQNLMEIMFSYVRSVEKELSSKAWIVQYLLDIRLLSLKRDSDIFVIYIMF